MVQGHPRQPASLNAELMIDDSAAAVGDEDFRSDWQWWLRTSNLLSLRGQNTTIGTRRDMATTGDMEAELAAMVAEAETGAASDERAVAVAGSGADDAHEPVASPVSVGDALPEPWQELVEEIDPDDADAAAEDTLLRALADLDVPLPDYGEEVHGVIANVSWPDARIAVFVSQSSDRLRPIADAGWTVINSSTADGDPQTMATAVKNALAERSGERA